MAQMGRDREGKVSLQKTGEKAGLPPHLVCLRNDIVHNTWCAELKQNCLKLVPTMLKVVKVRRTSV